MRKSIVKSLSLKGLLVVSATAIFATGCTRDLLWADELLEKQKGDEMLSISYQVERMEFRTYQNPDDPLAKTRSVPNIEKERFDLKLSRSGEVETFTELLTPSDNFEINESLGATEKPVKYYHYVGGVLKSFNGDRGLITAVESPFLKNGYDEMYSRLMEKGANEEAFKAQLTGGMFLLPESDNSDQSSTANSGNNAGRSAAGLENAYDNHEAYRVIRTPYTTDDGKQYTNELIIHKASNTIRYVTDYNANLLPVTRMIHTYVTIDGKPQLKATHEEHLISTERTGPAKQVIVSTYDYYNVNINL